MTSRTTAVKQNYQSEIFKASRPARSEGLVVPQLEAMLKRTKVTIWRGLLPPETVRHNEAVLAS